MVHRASLPEDEVGRVRGIPVTSVPRTMFDLAGMLDERQVERAWNEMEVRECTDRLSVVDLLERYPGRKGSVALGRLANRKALPVGITRNDFEEAFSFSVQPTSRLGPCSGPRTSAGGPPDGGPRSSTHPHPRPPAGSHCCCRPDQSRGPDTEPSMDRNLSLITPTGQLTLGNHLGALRRFVALADKSGGRVFFGLSDLHALTTPQDPAVLRATVTEMATLFLAAGLDPARVTLFRQSLVPAHRKLLAYLLECTAYTGELNRMIQLKEKGRGVPSTRASLFTYPALMAADILLYRPSVVPVGDDQRQHVELTRDLAIRFNHSDGQVFVVPEVRTPAAGDG